MNNSLTYMMENWLVSRNDTQWVLGTVYKTEGSAYRKAGAMMMINGLGQVFGLLSGGCLEADIQRNARKVMQSGRAMTIAYDATDEDDLSFQLGIGCGGKVYILLQPVTEQNDLQLSKLAEALLARKEGIFSQLIPDETGAVEGRFTELEEFNHLLAKKHYPQIKQIGTEQWLMSHIKPDPHLLIVGGGIDARPVARMAKELGWYVTVADPRAANARREYFPNIDNVIRDLGAPLKDAAGHNRVDAAILMAHSIKIDALALKTLHNLPLKHISMLGPVHRRDQVFQAAELSLKDLKCSLSGPAGLEIGGSLPESIALSILAEIHGVLHGKSYQQQDYKAAAE